LRESFYCSWGSYAEGGGHARKNNSSGGREESVGERARMFEEQGLRKKKDLFFVKAHGQGGKGILPGKSPPVERNTDKTSRGRSPHPARLGGRWKEGGEEGFNERRGRNNGLEGAGIGRPSPSGRDSRGRVN